MVKAPGGWPTGDPASVLGKGFLFHINLHSWGNYARRHGESYLRVADEREEEDQLAMETAAQLAAVRVDPAGQPKTRLDLGASDPPSGRLLFCYFILKSE